MQLHMQFNPSLRAVGCCEAPGEQLAVQCFAQGHFDMQTVGAGDQTANLAVKGVLLYPLSGQHDAPSLECYQNALHSCLHRQ